METGERFVFVHPGNEGNAGEVSGVQVSLRENTLNIRPERVKLRKKELKSSFQDEKNVDVFIQPVSGTGLNWFKISLQPAVSLWRRTKGLYSGFFLPGFLQ